MKPAATLPFAGFGRDTGLDFVKGVLVVVMVLYHAMNYFADAPAAYYGYLRFVNGAFVFITGYVVAVFRADAALTGGHSPVAPLALRGAKLLGLFTALNLAIGAGGVTNYKNVTFDIGGYFERAGAVYLSGDAAQIAFRILAPISYVLMISALYLAAGRAQAALIVTTLAAAAMYSLVLPITPNGFFVLTGLVGLSLGLMQRRFGRPHVHGVTALLAGLILLAALMNTLSSNALAYALGIAVMMALLHDGARRVAAHTRSYNALVLLGRYSLVGYIVQIGFLFLLHRSLHGRTLPPGAGLALAFVATCAIVFAISHGLEAMRRRSGLVERTYRLVFA